MIFGIEIGEKENNNSLIMNNVKIDSVSVQTMSDMDLFLESKYHVNVLQTMEAAGYNIAQFIQQKFRKIQSICILIGKGHNGGDGLVTARHLHNSGKNISVVLSDTHLTEIPFFHLKVLKSLNIKIENTLSFSGELVVDCLLGYSAKGAPRGRIGELINIVSQSQVSVLSVDIPSGLDVSTGEWYEPSFKNSICFTLGLPKTHMIGNPFIKELYIGDIGIPPELYKQFNIKNYPYFKNGQGFFKI